jgi:hypothetical protein
LPHRKVSIGRTKEFRVADRNTITSGDSLTFDAFAKSLVDRFGQALPKAWRPTPDYEIVQARDPIVREFLQE